MLVITGVGRCGTSFVSAVLEKCGHGPGGLYDPDVRAGYENPRLSECNNLIGRAYPVSGPVSAEPFRATITACNRHVIKDPRFFSKPGVLESWLRFRSDLKFLVMFREPRESVLSARATISKDRTRDTLGEDVLSCERAFTAALWTLMRSNARFSIVRFPGVLADPGSLYDALWYLDHRLPRPAFDEAFRLTADPALVTIKSRPSPATGAMGFGVVPGSVSYERIGAQFVDLLRTKAGLQDDDTLLDVGCGFGRMARALAAACACRRYFGFDVVQDAIAYCRDRIEAVNGAFRFQWVDVANPLYNPVGELSTAAFVWPVRDGQFDRCLAASVFTHLRPTDVRRYLAEAWRSLRPGGTFLSSWFVEDEQSIGALRGRAAHPWQQTADGYWVAQPNLHEAAIAHRLSDVRLWAQEAGFEFVSLDHGKWCDPAAEIHCGQDVIVLRKPDQETVNAVASH